MLNLLRNNYKKLKDMQRVKKYRKINKQNKIIRNLKNMKNDQLINKEITTYLHPKKMMIDYISFIQSKLFLESFL